MLTQRCYLVFQHRALHFPTVLPGTSETRRVCEPVQTLPHVSEILRTFKKQARAMAQAAGGQPGTAVDCTRFQSSPCRISGPQTDTGTGCLSEKFGRRASIIPPTLSVHSLLDYQHIIILATDSVFVKHLNVGTYTVHR